MRLFIPRFAEILSYVCDRQCEPYVVEHSLQGINFAQIRGFKVTDYRPSTPANVALL